jgi:hypothetical protein
MIKAFTTYQLRNAYRLGEKLWTGITCLWVWSGDGRTVVNSQSAEVELRRDDLNREDGRFRVGHGNFPFTPTDNTQPLCPLHIFPIIFLQIPSHKCHG